MHVTEIAHAIEIDYSVFKNLKALMISALEPYVFPRRLRLCNHVRLRHHAANVILRACVIMSAYVTMPPTSSYAPV
ncbi:MAG: hypothetical protein LBJ64_12290 [Deltaproteobacteria bacterium]|jgi:hypothetical protein|nr:hypothetical protein [Deltaproteobacteria bacterium]